MMTVEFQSLLVVPDGGTVIQTPTGTRSRSSRWNLEFGVDIFFKVERGLGFELELGLETWTQTRTRNYSMLRCT